MSPRTSAPKASRRIPTPRQLLGFEIAERPMHHHEMAACLSAMASASDRAVLSHYGETPTGRRLFKLTISSPRNLARLTQIGKELVRLGNDGVAAPAARKLVASLPAVAWLGYGIHGDEISGTDAAVELVYRLLSGQDAETKALLDKLVIHVDPMVNPDGRERCLAHHTAFSRRQPFDDPQDIFQNQLWPEGRGNHYLFDMNRDAIFTVQAQSRARVAAILEAKPQLFVDAHEMNAIDSYLFAVPAEPLNPHLPAAVHDSWSEFGTDHGEALDAAGINYYTRSWNEVFYPGFFDIWPSYHGAVPILYEQSATGGVTVRLPSGKVRSYREAVVNQLTSSLANLRTAADRKEDLLMRWWQSRTDAAAGARAQLRNDKRAGDGAGAAAEWLIPPCDGYKQTRLLELLATQSLQCEVLSRPVEIDGLHSVWKAEAQRVRLPAGTIRVRTAQPLGALVRNIFDFHVPLAPEFLLRERQGLDLGSKTLLFDATAWSLPLAFGIEAYWTKSASKGEWRPLATRATAQFAALPGARARYGYIYEDPSLAATAKLLRAGIKVRVAREAFVHEGIRYEAGTLLLRRDDQEQLTADALRAVLGDAAGVRLVPVERARMDEGPDLGGSEFVLLSAPSIAILTGSGFNAPNTGALWHLFDVEIGMPVTLLEFARPGGFDLCGYSVIVIADTMDRAALVAGLKHGWLEKLRHWVGAGGTLIALSGSALALAEAGFTGTQPRAAVIESYPPLALGRPAASAIDQDFARATGSSTVSSRAGASDAESRLAVVGAGARAFLPKNAEVFEFPEALPTQEEWLADVPRTGQTHAGIGELLRKYLPRGAYLRASFKPQHWLRLGVADQLPALFREADALVADRGSIDLVGRYAAPADLALSGLVWPEAVGYVAGTAYLTRERMGQGQVVLFANDPVFRGYSLGTQRLFLNAALLGPGFKSI